MLFLLRLVADVSEYVVAGAALGVVFYLIDFELFPASLIYLSNFPFLVVVKLVYNVRIGISYCLKKILFVSNNFPLFKEAKFFSVYCMVFSCNLMLTLIFI